MVAILSAEAAPPRSRVARPAPLTPAPGARRAARLAPVAVGLVALLIVGIGNWTPSVWFDEAATITSTQRSIPQLFHEVRYVDAVHALYYLVMHGWFELVGYTPFTLRLPSAIAVAVTAGLLTHAVAARRGLAAGVVVGLVYPLIPRVAWMGGEGRSYALAALVALVMTLAFLRALRGGHRGWWVVYGATIVLGTALFVYLLLIPVGHAVALAVLWARRRVRVRGSVGGWVLACLGAGVVILPFFLLLITQAKQIEWVEPLGSGTWRAVVQTQWFLHSPVFAVVGWVLLAAGCVLLVRRGGTAGLVVVTTAFAPLAVLLFASVVYQPLYSPRYLAICAPFVAVAIGLALCALPTPRPSRMPWTPAVAVLALAAITVPLLATDLRQPDAKQNSTWQQVSELIAEQRREHPGRTAIVYGPIRYHLKASARVIAYAYPEPFRGTLDVTLVRPAAEGRLWELRGRLFDSIDEIPASSATSTYLVTSVKRDRRGNTASAMAFIGWRPAEEWRLGDVNVVRYEKDPTVTRQPWVSEIRDPDPVPTG